MIDAAAGTLTYTPRANANGPDRLVYGVSDGHVITEGVIDITITPVNDAPIARTENIVLRAGAPLTIAASTLLANDSDAEGSPLQLVGVAPLLNGAVSFDAVSGQVVFTPSIIKGPAAFTYTVSDGETQSVGQVWVNVDPGADLVATRIDTTLDLPLAQLLANDPVAAGRSLTILRVEAASNGVATLDLANGRVRFTPASGFSGTASFRYVTTDGVVEAASAVSILVVAGSGPLVAQDAVSTLIDTALELPAAALLANDAHPLGLPLTIASVGDAVGGTVSLVGDTIRFVPDAGSLATGSFRYTVSDGTTTANGTVTVAIRENRAPVFQPTVLTVMEDAPLTLTFDQAVARFRDYDGQPLSFVRAENAINGAVTVDAANRTITFRGTANVWGAASFQLVVSDGVTETAGEVQVTIRAVDDAPVLPAPIVFTATPGKPLVVSVAAILAAFTDIDGGLLSLRSITGGAASLDVSGQWVTVAPLASAADQSVISFEYQSLAGRSQAIFTVKAAEAVTPQAEVVEFAQADATAERKQTADTDDTVPPAPLLATAFALPAPVLSASARALIMPDLPTGSIALAEAVPAHVVAQKGGHEQSMLLAALLAGGVNLSAYRKAAQRKASGGQAAESDALLSPFLSGGEEEDFAVTLWDEGDADDFVRSAVPWETGSQ